MNKFLCAVLFVMAFSLPSAVADYASGLAFQAMLQSAASSTPLNANYPVRFSIKEASTQTTLWTKTYASLPINKGLLTVTLSGADDSSVGLPVALSNAVVFPGGAAPSLTVDVAIDSNRDGNFASSFTGLSLNAVPVSYIANQCFHVAPGGVDANSIADGSITSNKLQNGSVSLSKIASGSAATGQVLQWNGTAWTPATISTSGGSGSGGAPSGSAGGDLVGTYPNPTLASSGVTAGTYSKVTVDAKGRVTAGSAIGASDLPLATSSQAGAIQATTGKLTVNAQGVITNISADSCAVASTALTANQIQGVPITSSTPLNAQVLAYNGSAWAPTTLSLAVGTVTSVSGTGSVSVSTGTSTPVISVSDASVTASGVVNTSAQTFAGQKTFNAGAVIGASGDLRFSNATTGVVGFKAPSTATATTIWTLPVADGSAGQILSTNGSGVLSWANASIVSSGVTSVSGTGAITVTGTTTPVVSVADASASAKGVLQVGTGLSAASGVVSVSYGTTGTTAAAGNDSRFSDSRAPSGTAGGDLTGTYPNPTLSVSGVTAGTYSKVTVDAKGRVTGGTAIGSSDLPVATSSQAGAIQATTGKLTVNAQGAITNIAADSSAIAAVATTANQIQGVAIASATPINAQVLSYNGTAWTPTTLSLSSGTVTSVSGSGAISVTSGTTTPAISIADATTAAKGAVQIGTGLSVTSGVASVAYGTTATTAAAGNDSRFSDSRAPSGTAGGDLTASYPNPTLAASGVTAGTYSKVTVDAKGRVTTGAAITSSDLPLSTSSQAGAIVATSGKITVDTSGNITNISADSCTLATTATTAITANKIQGVLVSSTTPTSSQVLAYNGTAWTPTTLTLNSGTVTSVSGSGAVTVTNGTTTPSISIADASTSTKGVVQLGTTGTTAAAGNDSRFSDARTPAGSAGGDLTGSFPNPTLVASGVTAGTYAKVTVDAKGRVTSGAALSSSDLPIASSSQLGAIFATSGKLAVDSSGAITSISGDKLQGIPVATATPTSSQVLAYNGTSWTPTSLSLNSGTVTSVSGSGAISVSSGTTTPSISIADATTSTKGAVQIGSGLSVTAGTVSVAYGTSATTAAAGNDSRFSDSRAPAGSAGGDLTGSYPNPTLAASGVTAGTYPKVTVDAKGRVTAGAALASSDLPVSTSSQAGAMVATTGKITVDGSGNITNIAADSCAVATTATSANKIQGVSVTSTTPTSSQVLAYNGSAWAPTTLNLTSGTVTSVSGTGAVSVTTGTTTPVISVADATTTVSGAVKLITGSATLTFGSMLVNVVTEKSFTVTGAVAGDAVACSPAAAMTASFMWSCYVTAADTVTVRLVYLGGVSATPAAVLWKARIVK